MKIKAIFSHLLSLSAIFVLASCGAKDIVFTRYDYMPLVTDNHEVIEGDNYIKRGDYLALNYLNGSGESESLASYSEMFRTTNYLKMMNTTGVSKMIVIPVDFADYSCSNLGHGCALSKTIIENAFFGDESVNQFESVASFFDKSSYGKLKIDGKVTDWYSSPISYEELRQKNTSKSTILKIYNSALSWYKEKYDDVSAYYVNGNESLGVPIYLVYSGPNATGENASDSALWAYTFNSGGLTAWTSFNMLNLDMYNRPDAHTLIHETGHLLGLLDYYAENGNYSPTGHADMMDYSIGDETGYSKMCLDWTRPYYVNGSTTIKIKNFASSGDLILLNDNWNGSVMDEYLLMELYSPTGLNEYDAKHQQDNAKLMTNTGIKIYHVDARVAFYNSRIFPISYASAGGYSKTNTRIGLAHTNTIRNTTEYNKYALYQLLEKSGNNSFLLGNEATNDTLFYAGDSFGINTFINYKFHDGTPLNYTINIDSIINNESTITITKI